MNRRLLLASLALLSTMALSAPADAATTIGVVPSGPLTASAGDVVSLSPIPAYAVPFPGVITSWTTSGVKRADGAPTPQAALKVFETTTDPAGRLTATVTGGTKPFYLDEDSRARFTRVSVAGGEQIGLRYPKPGPVFTAGAESRACSAEGVGEPRTAYAEGGALACESGKGVAVSVTLEEDDDGDGFGDETQDRCPTIGGRATGCPGRYRGRVLGLPLDFRFGTRESDGADGERTLTVLERDEYGVRLRCPDGYETAYILFDGVRSGQPVYVRANGDFRYARGMARGGGVTGGHTEVAGHLSGRRASGTVSGAVRLRQHGLCDIRPYSWRIRS